MLPCVLSDCHTAEHTLAVKPIDDTPVGHSTLWALRGELFGVPNWGALGDIPLEG